MSDRWVTTRTNVLIALTVLFNSVGNVLLSVGMKGVGEVPSFSPGVLADIGWRAFTTGTIWLGITALVLFFVSYLLLLSRADYSYVLPASAGGYAVVTLLGAIVAGEHVGPVRWTGVLLISSGVALVGRTPVRTTEPG